MPLYELGGLRVDIEELIKAIPLYLERCDSSSLTIIKLLGNGDYEENWWIYKGIVLRRGAI